MISLEATLRLLESTDKGLTREEVNNRLNVFGRNEITEKKRNVLVEFILRFWGPMPWLLELAMALSFVVKHPLEGGIIFFLLTLNAIIGQIHSHGSQETMELLKKKLAIKVKALRDGQWTVNDAAGIVPGDIIVVRLGDIVPADTKILNGEISVDEASLTGESLPVETHPSGIICSGSVVRQGEAKGVVVNTGINTYFGKTAELIKIAKPKSHQEEIMMGIIKYMIFIGAAALVLILMFTVIAHIKESAITILTLIVVFLIGTIPVALPVVLTIVQAVGAKELAQKGALVTRLSSLEEAASIDILCFDKTGTVTQNKLSIVDVLPFGGFTKNDVIRAAYLASKKEGMDSIDLVVIDYSKKEGIDLGSFRQIAYTPFNPALKRTEAVIEGNGKRFKVVKGASQVIMSLCHGLSKETIETINKTIEEYSQKGYRVIAVGKSPENDLRNIVFVGLFTLADPLRADSKAVLEQVRKLGIKTLMLTGDSINIAREIARQVGIGDKIIRLKDIQGMTEKKKVEILWQSDGIAEIYPEDKYMIVKLLQSNGKKVGMTGDGVNDASALKQAEMGIAVSNSTDVAKSSASVVLTESGLGVIIDTITISRQIYQRMLTWVINKIVKVIEFVGVITMSFFWFHDIILSLLGISFLVLGNDFVTISLATDNVRYTSNPNQWGIKNITLAATIPALLLIAEGLIVIFIGVHYFHLAWEKLRTLVMLNFIFNSQFRIFVLRERRHCWSSVPGRELTYFSVYTIITFLLLGVFGIFIPSLSLGQILIVLGISALFVFIMDFPKYYLFKRFKL